MTRLFLIGLTWFALSTRAPAGLSSNSIRERLKQAVVQHTWHSVSTMPAPLRAALASTFHQPRLELANPGERWAGNVAVINEGEKLPAGRRLLFAFETSDLYVVYVEYSPPAVHTAVLIFDKSSRSRPAFVWGGTDLQLKPPARGAKDLIRMIGGNRFEEEAGTVW